MNNLNRYRNLIDKNLLELTNSTGIELKNLYEPIKYILSLGGKRLRPTLTLMATEAFDGNINDAVFPAIGIEVFHNFTLMHDDIMDEAPRRRNKETVHKKWNQNSAILSGDAMLVLAYEQIAKCPLNVLPQALNLFNKIAVKVCEGQQLDMDYEQNNNVSINQYIEMIRLKTAVLVGGALQLGALIANAPEKDCRNIYDFGQNLGIAFQLMDDILDVYGDTAKFGKQQGGDIKANKKTFLLLTLTEQAEERDKNKLNEIMAPTYFSDNKVNDVIDLYNKYNIKKLAEDEMEKYYQRSLQNIKALKISDEKKQIFLSFAKQIMVRES